MPSAETEYIVEMRKEEKRGGVIYEDWDVAELGGMMPRNWEEDNCLSMLGVVLFFCASEKATAVIGSAPLPLL